MGRAYLLGFLIKWIKIDSFVYSKWRPKYPSWPNQADRRNFVYFRYTFHSYTTGNHRLRFARLSSDIHQIMWCNAFTFAILHFWISANFEPTCQGPLVLLLFLSVVKGSHSPIDFFMSPGWRSDHGLAARRPNAQHMQRRENWEEIFPKSNVKICIFC